MGGDSMTKVFVVDGRLEHIGEWEYMVTTRTLETTPWTGEGDPPEDWDYGWVSEETINNPLPDGAIELDAEIAETAKGRIVLASDWHALREDAYPPLKDQLDAMWKGGEAAEEMAVLVQAVKEKYPKTEADQ